MPLVNLAALNKKQIQDFLDSFDIVFSDCDGVLWYLEKPIPGAIDTVSRIQKLGKKLYLVTNNSNFGAIRYRDKLNTMGLEVKLEQVINATSVICWYLKKIQFNGEAFVIASPSFQQVLIDAGIKITPEIPNIIEGNVASTLRAVQDRPSVKAVIIDFSLYTDWAMMAFAISCLRRKDVLYLCGAREEWIICDVDKKMFGSGPLIDVISKQSGRTPIECAKPSEALKNFMIEACEIKDPKRCLFIGDTLNYDIQFGKMCGFRTLLVGTGLDNIKDAELLIEEKQPDYYIPSLELLQPFLQNRPTSNNVHT